MFAATGRTWFRLICLLVLSVSCLIATIANEDVTRGEQCDYFGNDFLQCHQDAPDDVIVNPSSKSISIPKNAFGDWEGKVPIPIAKISYHPRPGPDPGIHPPSPLPHPPRAPLPPNPAKPNLTVDINPGCNDTFAFDWHDTDRTFHMMLKKPLSEDHYNINITLHLPPEEHDKNCINSTLIYVYVEDEGSTDPGLTSTPSTVNVSTTPGDTNYTSPMSTTLEPGPSNETSTSTTPSSTESPSTTPPTTLSSSTTEDSTSTTITTPTPSSSSAPISTPASSSETTTTITSTSSVPLSSTSLRPVPTIPSTSASDTCPVRCSQSELNGRNWTACAGETAWQDCSIPNSDPAGYATWRCSSGGRFYTRQPDYSKCKSRWIEELMEEVDQGINGTDTALLYLKTASEKLCTNQEANFYGHEISSISTMVSRLLDDVDPLTETVDDFLEVAWEAVNVTNRILAFPSPWLYLYEDQRCNFSTTLISVMEKTSFLLSNKSGNTTTLEEVLMDSSQLFVKSMAFPKDSYQASQEFGFPYQESSSESLKGAHITLPQGWANTDTDTSDKVELVGIIMNASVVSVTMPGAAESLTIEVTEEGGGLVMNSQLLSLTIGSALSSTPNYRFQEGRTARLTFQHEYRAWGDTQVNFTRYLRVGEGEKALAVRGSAQCVYWDTENLTWSQEGCTLISSSSWESICECNHLTSFALLMDLHNYTGRDRVLEIVTIVLSTLSILCLALTIFVFVTVKVAKNNPKMMITTHLCICLLIGNILVLFFLDRSYLNVPDGLCITTGILLHYTFLSAFGWMAIQGVHLYHSVINVFNYSTSPTLIYKISAYGTPLVIVGVTAMIGYLTNGGDKDGPYGNELVCWLNGNYVIGGFMGPVLVIILTNSIILTLSIRKSYLAQKYSVNIGMVSFRKATKLRTLMQGCFALSILMGLTWLIGYFMLIPNQVSGLIFAYFFTILNASQGIIIFTFDLCVNEKMKQAVYQTWGRYLPTFFNTWLKKSPSSTPPSSGSRGPPLGRLRTMSTKVKMENSNSTTFVSSSSIKSSSSEGSTMSSGSGVMILKNNSNNSDKTRKVTFSGMKKNMNIGRRK